jgi:hypothetical protein
MKRLITPLLVLVLVLGTAPLAFGADEWAGYVTETHCGAAGAKAEHADCAIKCVKEKGAKWAIYNPADKSMFVLSGDDAMMEKMAGKKVKVKGSMDKDKKIITVASMEQAG